MARLLRQALARLDKFLSIEVNPEPVVLSRIQSAADVQKWRVFSDAAFGGNSKGTLELCTEEGADVQGTAPSTSAPGAAATHTSQAGSPFMRFSGRYSTELSEGATLLRAGYVGCNLVFPKSLDLSLHDFLELRMRSRDGHTYVANVRSDNYTGGDEEVWQAPLRPSRPGEWESVAVHFNELIYTVRGRVASQQASGRMPRDSVMAVGLTLPVTQGMGSQGDFCLDIASVEAKAVYRQGGAAQEKAFQGYLSSHEEPKAPTDWASPDPFTHSGASQKQDAWEAGAIGGRGLRQRTKQQSLDRNSQSQKGGEQQQEEHKEHKRQSHS